MKRAQQASVAGCNSASQNIALQVLPTGRRTVQPSRMSRRRAISLAAVHVLIIAHIIHWMYARRTLSPVEPSESMYTLNNGYLNAGFLFFALALLATLITGRFVCGWGCHLIAYQDLSAWLLKRIGIKPKPFRSRLLILAPLALALYMFVWPSVYRSWLDIPAPRLANHLVVADFWKTFPGPTVAILTVVVCGFGIVYFLGSKGFCTYACPYGGFFRVADKLAPGRIVVSDACEHCGHCTAACSSNVRVHEEVATYGMVVDPGCMKCMDCVSVCPNNALRVGFARPALVARPTESRKPKRYDFALWEEAAMAIIGVGALLAFRGLYNMVPLLLAMAMAGMAAYLTMLSLRTLRLPNVRLQQLQLRRGGRLMWAGVTVQVATVLTLAFAAHSAVVQYHAWYGQRLVRSLTLPDSIWALDNRWPDTSTPEQRDNLAKAIAQLKQADRWGLLQTPTVLRSLVWCYVARNEDANAETIVRRLIAANADQTDLHRALGDLLRKTNRLSDAEKSYRSALQIDPDNTLARISLATTLATQARLDEAINEYRLAVTDDPSAVAARLELSRLLLRTGHTEEAVPVLTELLEHDETRTEAHYNLGMVLLGQGKTEEAIPHLRDAAKLQPDFAEAHYNLAVATFMAGRPADAFPSIREATRLRPNDAQAKAFLKVVQDAIAGGGDAP